jgi:hypothetical protein
VALIDPKPLTRRSIGELLAKAFPEYAMVVAHGHASTEQQLGRSTGTVTVSLAKMNPKRCAEVFVFGHFRQILSALTRNGRDPARLWDAEDGIVRSVH